MTKKIYLETLKSVLGGSILHYYQIRRKSRIWPHLLRKSLMENFNFCVVTVVEKVKLELALTIFFTVLIIRKNDWPFFFAISNGLYSLCF